MTKKERLQRILALFRMEAAGTRRGANAGTRLEGRIWQDKMLPLLEHPSVHLVTQTGKSTYGVLIDGNVYERNTFKMLEYVQDPQGKDAMYIAMNSRWAELSSPKLAVIRRHAGILSRPSAQIWVLATEKEYRAYVARYF